MTSWASSSDYSTTPALHWRLRRVTLGVAAAFQRIPRDALGDPWDRFIGATAMALELPLVTRDRKMTELDLIETIW